MHDVKTYRNFLPLSWSISRGRDTYGYNIRRLDDPMTGKRYRCSGGGYDMTGTVFAQWLESEFQSQLLAIATRFSSWTKATGFVRNEKPDALYGGTFYPDTARVGLDGSCGLSSMQTIADAIGLDINATYNRRGTGGPTGLFVSPKV